MFVKSRHDLDRVTVRVVGGGRNRGIGEKIGGRNLEKLAGDKSGKKVQGGRGGREVAR